MKNKTIIDRWEKIGFLKGLDDKQKEIAQNGTNQSCRFFAPSIAVCRISDQYQQKSIDLVRIVYNFDILSGCVELWQSTYYNQYKRGQNHAEKRTYFDL